MPKEAKQWIILWRNTSRTECCKCKTV